MDIAIIIFSSTGTAFQPVHHCGSSRRASAHSYAVDGRLLGVGSAENLLDAVLEIHFATYKTLLLTLPGPSNASASLVSQLLTACSSSSTTASRFINAVAPPPPPPSPRAHRERPSHSGPPTPCKPCIAGRIKSSLPNRTLLITRRIVKTTNLQATKGALKPSYKGYRSKRQGYIVGVLPRKYNLYRGIITFYYFYLFLLAFLLFFLLFHLPFLPV